MHSFLKKLNISYLEEILEYETVPSVLFNSYSLCLKYGEVDV